MKGPLSHSASGKARTVVVTTEEVEVVWTLEEEEQCTKSALDSQGHCRLERHRLSWAGVRGGPISLHL